MKFAVLGGDDRSVRLCRLLKQDGHSVSAFAMEKALTYCAESAEDAVSGAGCIVLPLPCFVGEALNAPFSGKKHDIAELLKPAARGTSVCAGKAGGLRAVCSAFGLPLYDYFAREDLAVKNAALTAEGAVELMLRESAGAVLGSRVLICGFGRIGKMLAMRLAALGARVTVAARSAADLAWAECFGCESMRLDGVNTRKWDFVLNTIPWPVFDGDCIAAFGKAVLIELASPPYGFDLDAAEKSGRHISLASGLPGKTAPEKAAEIVRDTIYKILEESS